MRIDFKFVADMAELAEASYADLEKHSDPDVVRALKDAGFNGMSFSTTQAAGFVEKWSVLDHLSDTPSSDFSATLFRSKSGEDYVLALRGTAGGNDLQADGGDIVLDGAATDQIIDLYNYVQRLSAAKGGSYTIATKVRIEPPLNVVQMEQAENVANPWLPPNTLMSVDLATQHWAAKNGYVYDNPSGTVWKIELSETRTDGLGLINDSTPLHVTGHSLGGHLAAAFSRLFPDVTLDATMINGAGFNYGQALNKDRNIDNLFAALGGQSAFNAGTITNYIGSAGWDFVSQDMWIGLQQPGQKIEIETESFGAGVVAPNTTLGHGAGQMTDTLAVMGMLWRLDRSLTVSQLNQLQKESSGTSSRSLEDAMNSVAKVFGSARIPDGLDSLDTGREAFYAALVQITTRLDLLGESSPFSIIGLGELSSRDIAALAHQDTPQGQAVRFALKELSPFAIAGYAYGKEVDLYEVNTGTGELSKEWIADRAAMLSWKLKYDIGAKDADDALFFGDRSDKPYAEDWDSHTPGDWDFIDYTTAINGAPPAARHRWRRPLHPR
ncbi:hypothetical protein [Pseudogulbenkiania subflava]|uniref:Lipase (Class 3) n=1 Tax=Pseudogulbenkiania subflava DSM 22618 TaxID=1123014 RepID=A0A1Y6BAF2_9NEIS|nr:hypothetical protein [Pseudogulbenkiania subflava]SMF01492.1 hypothetical protein SAMN02745746_00726 [Pseudogulbenkiania subflava DSM 22618]